MDILNCSICCKQLIYKSRACFLRSKRNVNRKCKRCSQLGKIVSEETKIKMRLNRPDVSGKNNPMYGKVSSLRGKTWEEIYGKDKADKFRESQKSNPRNLGHRHSDEFKRKQSERMKGEKNHFYGKKHTQETITKVRNYTLGQINRGEFKHAKHTNIERKFVEYLNELNIKYEQYKILAFWTFDFYLPDYDVYIECDGDYWHSNPKFYGEGKKDLNQTQKNNLKNDKSKTSYMESHGRKFYRFWEHDILNNKQIIIPILKNMEKVILLQ